MAVAEIEEAASLCSWCCCHWGTEVAVTRTLRQAGWLWGFGHEESPGSPWKQKGVGEQAELWLQQWDDAPGAASQRYL